MRRQRFIYTLPSQDDSSLQYDSQNSSILSSNNSYPETVWSQIIQDPEPLIPYCLYQYPCFQVPAEPLSSVPSFLNPPLTPSSLISYDGISHYNDEFADNYDFVNASPNNTPYGDGLISEDYSNYDNSFAYDSIEGITQEIPNTYPMVTNYGAVTVLLRHLIRVDISPANAVYVTNPPATCIAAINGNGDRSCIIHPNGRIFHDGPEINLSTLNRKAKICRRGVVFTSTDHCLSYLVDASGTKTTADKFRDLSHDFSLEIFYNDTMIRGFIEECYKMVNDSRYKSYRNGDEVWFLGGFRIKQDQRGDVKVTRNSGRQVIRSSPTTGQVSIKTVSAEMSISRYPNHYFFVRKGDKQVSASVKGFNVQNGTQKAGFNCSGKVVLF